MYISKKFKLMLWRIWCIPLFNFLLLIQDFGRCFFKSLSLLGNVSHSQQQKIHPFALVLHSTWFPLSSPFHHLLAVWPWPGSLTSLLPHFPRLHNSVPFTEVCWGLKKEADGVSPYFPHSLATWQALWVPKIGGVESLSGENHSPFRNTHIRLPCETQGTMVLLHQDN